MMKIIKQKSVLPTMKEKRRYVAFEVISDSGIDFGDVKTGILKGLAELIGSLGLAKANPMFIGEMKGNKGIIKINNKHVDHLKASFVSLKELGGKEAIIRSTGVSGLLNKTRSNYIA